MSHYPRHRPDPKWSHANHAFSNHGSTAVPGLSYNQSAFAYNNTAIPGLSFDGSIPPWPLVAPLLPQHPPSLPNTIPPNAAAAPNAPASTDAVSTLAAPSANRNDDTAEEGELTESAFEDIYEPSLEAGEVSSSGNAPAPVSASDDDDYDPAHPGSPIQAPVAQRPSSNTDASTETSEQCM
jgi:hypothetical protein